MKKLRKSILYLIIITFISPLTIHAKMYMWVDENGVKHYSNTPPPKQAKNVKEEIEHKTNEAVYQRAMEQQKKFEEEIRAERQSSAEMREIKNEKAAQRRKQKDRERLANQFFKKMDDLSEEKFGDRRGDVLRGIGNALLSCPGADLNMAIKYYRDAESIVNDISECKSVYRNGTQFYSSKCIERLFNNAMNQKMAGDSYMGCSAEYTKTIEMEERIKRAERKAKKAVRRARAAEAAANRNW